MSFKYKFHNPVDGLVFRPEGYVYSSAVVYSEGLKSNNGVNEGADCKPSPAEVKIEESYTKAVNGNF